MAIAKTAAIGFGTALKRTGIGLIIIEIGLLTEAYMSFNESAKNSTDWLVNLEKNYKDQEKSVDGLKISLDRLTEAKFITD